MIILDPKTTLLIPYEPTAMADSCCYPLNGALPWRGQADIIGITEDELGAVQFILCNGRLRR